MLNNELEVYNIDDEFEKSLMSLQRMYYEGKIFIVPTDIMYSIGGNPFDKKAMDRLNSNLFAKSDDSDPTLLIDSISHLLKFIDIESEKYLDLLISLWPNPINVVFNLNSTYRERFGIEKAAFRIPNHRFSLRFLSEIQFPLFVIPINAENHLTTKCHEILKDKYSGKVDALFYTNKESFHIEPSEVDMCGNKPFLVRRNKLKILELLEKYS